MNPRPVTFAMAVHCHQPVGNFGFVFEEAYAKCYEPFLSALERHPRIRMSLHYSGPLLDWITDERPDFLKRLQERVRAGQIELLSSGYYEPILPVIPDADQRGQIRQMDERLRKLTGQPAAGLWLTERVWEPQLAAILQEAGIRYTVLDSSQLESARPWIAPESQVQDSEFWDLVDCFQTEHQGAGLTIFPASVRLRYWVPFQPPERTLDFLRSLKNRQQALITFADDGEKFGFWPGTHRWVFEQGWLDRFFTLLEQEEEWLATATLGEALKAHAPKQLVYVPASSYQEMMSWSAGSFRNFFLKYPESGAMQQRMLRVSGRLANLESDLGKLKPAAARKAAKPQGPADRIASARQSLYAGQCNCAYWHGVFGGLYLSHLRRAVHRNLIDAEAAVDEAEALLKRRIRPAVDSFESDLDGDGLPEWELRGSEAHLTVDPAEDGAITAWDIPKAGLNLLDTLHRHHEPYHDHLRGKKWRPSGTPGDQATQWNEPALQQEQALVYDRKRRLAFQDFALSELPDLSAAVNGTWRDRLVRETGSFQSEPAKAPAHRVLLVRQQGQGQLRKEITMQAAGSRIRCAYAVTDPETRCIALEFNFALRDPRYLQVPGCVESASSFELLEENAGITLSVKVDPPARLFHVPIETVSESEGGLERTYQGLSLLWCWQLPENRPWTATLDWRVSLLNK